MSRAVEEEILKHYTLTPREDYSSLAERLEQLQEAILKGEEPGKLLEQALTEAEETQYFEGLTFERAEALARMRRKANYLRELLHRRQYKRTVTRLQNELRELVSPEAWAVYLKIEEEVNLELARLREGACCVKIDTL